MRPSFTRRAVLAGGAASSLPWAWSFSQAAEQKQFRVGMLIGHGADSLIAAFRGELGRLGYVEGENLFLDVRDYLPDQARRHAVDLIKSDLDVVVAASLPQALLLRELDPTLKMVVGTAPGLVSNGFAKSFERPGGNVTGMDELPPGVTGTRLRLLKIAAPKISRVALLSTTPGRGGHETQLADAQAVAPELGLALKVYRAATPAELFAALASMVADRVNALVNFQGGLSLAHRERIVGFAQEHRLPAMYQSQFFVRAGGLMSYAPDQEDQYRQAARYVDSILRGANPGDLPILRPDRYYLTINRKAAAAIDLELSTAILEKADQIIE